jgi:hypothetical protein
VPLKADEVKGVPAPGPSGRLRSGDDVEIRILARLHPGDVGNILPNKGGVARRALEEDAKGSVLSLDCLKLPRQEEEGGSKEQAERPK